ncbi:hypothetical protein [Dyella sp. LX-1]|uniref:hypothetical protein n=1 Tax=Dyella sp. LX-1 TaxID=2838831 RepID=UPI001BE0298E|nr:hypothetical protein [Dyella sp. LX-1]MBT2119866.1 hypothetical protein [Dyella sp. LX-1]MBT2119877.1 hypothetical protein [Dyella sp. LX-1]
MNRQEFAAAYREARKVLALHELARDTWGVRGGVSSLFLAIDERVFRAANDRRVAWDVLLHRWVRHGGSWRRYSRSLRDEFYRPVRLPGGRA